LVKLDQKKINAVSYDQYRPADDFILVIIICRCTVLFACTVVCFAFFAGQVILVAILFVGGAPTRGHPVGLGGLDRLLGIIDEVLLLIVINTVLF